MRRLEAVLVDLDNTLILFDEPTFFNAYSQTLYRHFASLMSPEEFGQRLNSGTKAMIKNDGSRLNIDVFKDVFGDGLPTNGDQIWERFDDFYQHKFSQFQSLMQPIPGTAPLLTSLSNQNLKLVLATNPLFPDEVQHMRLQWAGLAAVPFDLITSVENSSFAKPNPQYFTTICKTIGVDAQTAVMVGNDPFNDMVAAYAGLRTYLTTDSEHVSIELSQALASDSHLQLPEPDAKGSILELDSYIETLM
ncbi:HAD family hydrolase [candidate division KSB1 bacterium]|nr:HAD family hydrolase [candidate division KSB1 bacterium]